jgi:hypothetical protein
VIHTGRRPAGPAAARNRGAAAASADLLVFVDADVRVRADTLHRFVELFAEHEEVDAAFGSYDDDPPEPGLVSRFRNLLHHHTHQECAGEAETFWAGCGAIRASVFRGVGGFDERRYRTPQIEDIELGRRLRRAGKRIVLDPTIQCAHLKRWELAGMVRTDFGSRGFPWFRLLLEENSAPHRRSLNLRGSERASAGGAALAVGSLALLPLAPFTAVSPLLLLAPTALGLALVVSLNRGFYRLLARRCGALGALTGVPLHLVYYSTATAAAAAAAIHAVVMPRGPVLRAFAALRRALRVG